MEREEILIDIIRKQSRLITLFQTEEAKNISFLYVHGIKTDKNVCVNGMKLRDDIKELKEQLRNQK